VGGGCGEDDVWDDPWERGAVERARKLGRLKAGVRREREAQKGGGRCAVRVGGLGN